MKTDNFNIDSKLDLRRYFLKKYHSDSPIRVMDCCQGSGRIWATLRNEFDVDSYWGIDLKPKKGRLKIASERILAQPGWTQNVIDIDTYGSPWNHWAAMLPNILCPVTVFLTVGHLHAGTIGRMGDVALEFLGLAALAKKLPAAFHVKLRKRVVPYCLAGAAKYGKTIVEAVEAVNIGNAKYFGVRVDVSSDIMA